MARNPVQFQKGISLNEFLSLYGTEEQCFDALYRWRWPNGFVCPNCGHDRGCQLTTHKLQQCYRCNRQTSITAGTIFEATKLPLTVWLQGIYFMTQDVTTHPCYQRHARRERSEWPPAGCSPDSPWTADSLRFGNRLRRTCGCGSILRLSA